MKKLMLILLIILSFSGCSKDITQKEYDNLHTSYQFLQSEYDDLVKKYEEIENLNSETITTLNDVTKKYMDLLSTEGNIVMEAWGTSTFGDDTEYSLLNNSTVQYKVAIKTVTINNISSVFNDFIENTGTLKLSADSQNITDVYIKVVNGDLKPLFELSFSTLDSEEPEPSMMINMDYSDIITNAININQ
jgi:hypothetical protein